MVKYTEDLPDFGKLMTKRCWLECVEEGGFTDDDGYGYAVKRKKYNIVPLYPSKANEIPKSATHVIWFNK